MSLCATALLSPNQSSGTFVRARIADYKIPDRILFLPSLPKGRTGKVQRRGLKDMLLVPGNCPDRKLIHRPSRRSLGVR